MVDGVVRVLVLAFGGRVLRAAGFPLGGGGGCGLRPAWRIDENREVEGLEVVPCMVELVDVDGCREVPDRQVGVWEPGRGEPRDARVVDVRAPTKGTDAVGGGGERKKKKRRERVRVLRKRSDITKGGGRSELRHQLFDAWSPA